MDGAIVSTAPVSAARPTRPREELVATLRLAGPLVGANLLQMAVYAVDVIFVARLSTVDFAAATLGVFLLSLIAWALIGLTSACAPLIAAELGRRRHAVRDVRRTFRMALWLALIAAAPCLVVLANGEAVLRLAGQAPPVAARAGAFLAIALFAIPSAILASVMRTAAAALGRPGWALAVTAGALLLGTVANWALVFGHAGFPALGLEGSALANVVVNAAQLAAWCAILLADPRLARWRLFGQWWRAEWSRLAEIVRLGAPIALTFTLEGALFGGASVLMGLIGITEVAAHAVALNIAALAFQVPLGVAQAATIRVGLAYGARDPVWIARAGWVAVALGIGFMALTAAAMWAVPRMLIGIYINVFDPREATVVALAVRLLALAALFQLFDGAQVVTAGVLRGLQDTRVPMVIAGIGYWAVGFVVAILFGFRLHWGAVGIWLGLLTGLIAVSALLLWRWSARARIGLLPSA